MHDDPVYKVIQSNGVHPRKCHDETELILRQVYEFHGELFTEHYVQAHLVGVPGTWYRYQVPPSAPVQRAIFRSWLQLVFIYPLLSFIYP